MNTPIQVRNDKRLAILKNGIIELLKNHNILRISPNISIGLRPLAYYIHLFQAGDFFLYVGKRRNIRTEKENESRRNCIDLNNGGNDLETLSISF